MDFSSGLILLLAFAAGLLHALDADHVMAVTAIASKKSGMKAIIRLCLRWSLGHGLVLFVVGSSILFLGLSLPEEMSAYAEKFVALILIGMGSWVLKDLYQSRTHIHFHRHQGFTGHAHLHTNGEHHKEKKRQPHTYLKSTKTKDSADHSPVLVGIVHGMAGLAPLLAVLPLANKPIWMGSVYLFIFCSGVFLSMLIFGGVLEKFVMYLQRYGSTSISFIRGFIGFTSISLGVIWLS